MIDKTSPKDKFDLLRGKQLLLLTRCEQYAAWTIPSKFPQNHTTDDDEQAVDFQSMGARAVNNLRNKAMLALFAPSRPFFRPNITQEVAAALAKQGVAGAGLDATLAQVAKLGMKSLEAMQIRSVLNETIDQLIITGNALLAYDEDEGAISLFTLRDYVVKRTPRNKLLEFIYRECSELSSFPENVQSAYKAKNLNAKPDEIVSLYSRVYRKGDTWHLEQSIEDILVQPESATQWADKDLPYRVLTWSLAPKRNYGTGLVEESQGAFHALSTLSSAMIPGLIEMCRIIHLANPTGVTDALEFQNALSGAVLAGKSDDLSTPDLGGKARDYATVVGAIESYKQDLAQLFLLATNVVRNAERVTAEEIRLLANELETSMGGVYSRLSYDLQQWLAEIAIKLIDVPELNDLDVYVVTGLDALSANGDLDNLRAMMADLTAAQNLPDEIKATIVWDSYVQLLASLHNVDYFKFLKSQAQAQAEAAAAQQNAMDMQQEQVAAEGAKEVLVNQMSQE